MEPLVQREGAGESAPPQEAVVAAVRSTTQQLQESVKELCGGSLEKIAAIRPSFLSASLILHLWSKSSSVTPAAGMFIRNLLLFSVNQEPLTGAGSADGGPARRQSTGEGNISPDYLPHKLHSFLF